MKKLSIIFLSLSVLSAYGAEIGVGASVRADDASIYLPVQFGESFRLEAELRAFEREAISTPVSSSSVTRSESSVDSKLFGLGAFYIKALNENLRTLLGLRASYVKTENDGASAISGLGATAFSVRDVDGYEITPTVGLEYILNEKVSISVEAFWFDRNQDGEITTTTTSGGFFPVTTVTTTDFSQDESGTDARVVLRFFF